MNVENLKKARKRSGLTQKEVADKIGVGQSTYKNYECGLREPNGDTIVMLSKIFNVSTDYLLGACSEEIEAIEELADKFNMTALEKKILEGYLALPENMRGDLMEFLQKSVREVMNEGGE